MLYDMKPRWRPHHQSSLATLYRTIDLVVILSSLFLCCALLNHEVTKNWLFIGFLSSTLFIFFSESVNLYRSWRVDTYTRMLGLTLISWGLVCTSLLLITYFSKTGEAYSRLVIGFWFLSTAASLSLWRYLLRVILFHIRSHNHNTRTGAILGITQPGIQLAADLAEESHHGIRIKGFYSAPEASSCDQKLIRNKNFNVLGSVNDAVSEAKLGKLEYIYIALSMKDEDQIQNILRLFSDTTATVYILPNLFVQSFLHSRWHQVGGSSILSIYDTPIEGINSWIKRSEDLLLGSILLILFSPLMVLIGLAIKATSNGPIIFKQLRYGLDGRPIRVWKFRTMSTLENGAHVVQARKNDPRVTAIGRFLRKTSLDELPQLINVIQGKMSIVGPRPHAVAHNEHFRKLIDGYMLRHKVKPGITGWAQINGFRGETDTTDKLRARIECDLHYINHWSIWLDIRVLLLTLPTVITAKNAY
ncbi:undecaprenyl-phosphate glucose phosphotransferase [Microbulbifer sp. SSSA002]|uniref:undecaprenyl-phosphate glucose phosphotransferase n=1 Tax=Microbulbifer sp. SSSA002 TaxID=3243376 RepID=UPI004039908A